MSSQALTKREAEQSLMPPPPPPKRIKRPAAVLDEDIYTNALSEIIARDFFPGLLETQIKQEYLEALESKDKEWIASSKRKLAEVTSGRTDGLRRAAGNITPTPQQPITTPRPGLPGDTPTGWGGETPMSVVSTESASTAEQKEKAGERIPDISNLGLLSFQGKYTSEDNESFNKLLDNQNEKRRDKYRWIWSGNKIPSARQIAHQRRETRRITARGGKPDDYEDEGQQDGNDDNQEGQQTKEQGEREEKVIKTDLDARPAKPDAWTARPENQLMFLPASIEDTHETVQQRAENQSRAGPKRVLYQNTRLQEQPPGNAPPPSPSISAIQNAIAGRPSLSASEAGSQVGGETPRVNGYSFVDEDEPDPTPTIDEDDDLHLLGKGSSTPNPFQIPQARKREDLHHRMVDGVARKKRAEKAARETKTPVVGTPRFASSPRLDFGLRTPAGAGATPGGGGKALTPAAQNLLRRVGSTPTPKSKGKDEGSGLRNMWAPTPRRR